MNSEEDSQEQQQNQQRSETQQQQQEEGPKATRVEPETAAGPSQSLGRAAPRSGALLVEVYGRVVRKQHNLFSPNQVLLDFTKYLVSFLIQSVLGIFKNDTLFNTMSNNNSPQNGCFVTSLSLLYAMSISL